jgi:glutamate synthase (ferredoxin)
MTAGTVVVLGPVGRNFAAGMSNGVAYVLDEAEVFTMRCNQDMVAVRDVTAEDDEVLRPLIREHAARTGSLRARAILAGWQRYRPLFRKVVPHAAPVAAPAAEPPVAAPAGGVTEIDAPRQ